MKELQIAIKAERKKLERCRDHLGELSDYGNGKDELLTVLENLILCGVGSSLPSRNTVISEIKKNLKEIKEDEKVTSIDFDLGYSLGFFDGFDFNK